MLCYEKDKAGSGWSLLKDD
jgi:hypothetical protein